jgi:N-formylglutamate deformylase
MRPVDIKSGEGVIVLGVPHSGTYLPPDIYANLRLPGRALADTDWHADRLCADLLPDATVVRANFHRYLIDANRDLDGSPLYDGANTTDLVPMTDFDGNAIWAEAPGRADIETRLAVWHHPYHAALAGELERVHRKYGLAVLVDCHSIRSRIPFLFEGVLPDINLGTNLGTSCDERSAEAAVNACRNGGGSHICSRRAVPGGWTTRHYGRPGKGVHAIQIELAQANYLASECVPFEYDSARAECLRSHLRGILRAIEDATTEMGQSHE